MKYSPIRVLILAIVTFVVTAIPLTGCKTNRLEPGGAYAPTTPVVTNGATNWVAAVAPDPVFYSTDVAFDFAYTLVDTAFTFEKNNRALLWSLSPEIKGTLDRLRPQAEAVVSAYTNARRNYILHPTPAGLGQLQTLLSQLQNISSAVQVALPPKTQ